MAKYFFILFLLTFVWLSILPVSAQVPPFHCLGSCPKVSLSPSGSRGVHPVGSSSVSISPSSAVSISPSSSAPSPASGSISISPSPSLTAPCNNQQQQQQQNYYRSWGKKRGFKPHGVLQQSTASIWQFILQLLQQLGIQIPGLTNIPCSSGTTSPIGGGGGGGTPSIFPIPSISTPGGGGGGSSISPVISTTVSTTVPSSSPISEVSPTTAPSSSGSTVSLPDSRLSNWAGYVYTVASGTTNASITSTWNNASVTCSTKGVVSPWPGFGGYN